MKIQNVAIIGVGRVGSNLALRFFENGFSVVSLIDVEPLRVKNLAYQVNCPLVSTRYQELPDAAELVVITTPDNLITDVCRQISELSLFFEKKIVLHCSGVLSSVALETVRRKGALVASMHPVQTFIPVEFGQTQLEGVFWAIEGDPAALVEVRRLVRRFGANCFEIPAKKKDLYHAACVISSNYLVALAQINTLLFAQLGISVEQSSEIVAPLQESTLKNIQQTGPETALTGPIARGDLVTVEKHLEIIKKQIPSVLRAYVELGRVLLGLCEVNQILEAGIILEFEQLFRKYVKN